MDYNIEDTDVRIFNIDMFALKTRFGTFAHIGGILWRVKRCQCCAFLFSYLLCDLNQVNLCHHYSKS